MTTSYAANAASLEYYYEDVTKIEDCYREKKETKKYTGIAGCAFFDSSTSAYFVELTPLTATTSPFINKRLRIHNQEEQTSSSSCSSSRSSSRIINVLARTKLLVFLALICCAVVFLLVMSPPMTIAKFLDKMIILRKSVTRTTAATIASTITTTTTATMTSSNDFIHDFTTAIQPIHNITQLATSWPPPNGIFSIPFILHDGKLLCSPNIHDITTINQLTRERTRHFIDLVQSTLHSSTWLNLRPLQHRNGNMLPFLLMIADQNGCIVDDSSSTQQIDIYNYPRFSWSIPSSSLSSSLSTNWCKSISIPSYINWQTFHTYDTKHWNTIFKSNNKLYPWSTKLPLAVWRGSTTASPKYTQNSSVTLQDTPRGQLVQLSNEYPNLIDAMFVNFVNNFQHYQDNNNTNLNNTTNTSTTTTRMPFDKQMSYQAIIDIDGNNWSGRFAKLLCTNSVIIKIIPEYIEYFYTDLIPNVHYMSATLANLTTVVKYVLDSTNTNEMQNVVLEANKWCSRSMTHDSLVGDMLTQIVQYENEYNNYMKKMMITTSELGTTIISSTDFVECGV